MAKFKIKNRFTGIVLFEYETDSLEIALRAAIKVGANLAGANLTGANLAGADLFRANLTGANLTGANLTGANLAGANLTGADLFRANLTGANLTGANLAGANLTGANLAGANLTGANLTGANLTGANLAGANLAGANLAGADLFRANLAGANLFRANLTGASYGKNIPVTKTPLQLLGNKYRVFIFDTHMKIGCELHSMVDWFNFSDEQISQMGGESALKLWRVWKDSLMQICIASQRYKIKPGDANAKT